MRGYYRQRSKAGHQMSRPNMRQEPDISAVRRFYAEGGYCAPAPVERARGGSAKVSKASVSYGPGMGKTRCRNCRHYEGGSCELVRGAIDPAYWCNRFDYWPEKMRDGEKLTFAEGGKVADDFNLYQSQYYAQGGSVKAIRNWIRTLMDGLEMPIGVRADEEVVDKIIKDGRFKSQHETRTSHGLFDPKARERTETALFGLPTDLPVEQRPIYGYILDPESEISRTRARGYGDIISILKPHVKDRTSFTLDDSLGSRGTGHERAFRYTESPRDLMRDLSQWEWLYSGSNYSPITYRDMWDNAAPSNYIEAQVHGGLPWNDVSHLIWGNPRSRRVVYPDQRQAKADAAGKPLFYRDETSFNPAAWQLHEPGGPAAGREFGPVITKGDVGYAQGGSVDDDLLAYMSQYYATGGGVDPNAGASGIGVYDQTVDGPMGYAGGGAIKYIKGLLGQALTAERSALDKVGDITRKTGNESIVYGHPHASPEFNSVPAIGDRYSVGMPDGYEQYMTNSRLPAFTAHTHPEGLPIPSPGDLRAWSNFSLHDVVPQSMWIKNTRFPDDAGLVRIDPYDAEHAYGKSDAMRLANDARLIYANASNRSPYEVSRQKERLSNFVGSSLMPQEDVGRFLTSLDLGWYAHRLAKKGLPLNIESTTRLSPNSPVTVEEAWPELIKYYDKLGYSPYAEGGQVGAEDIVEIVNRYLTGGQVEDEQ